MYESNVVAAKINGAGAHLIQKAEGIVPRELLYYDNPRLFIPHVTIVRGLSDNHMAKLQRHLPNQPLSMQCMGWKVLSCGANPYIVLSIEVKCDELQQLNAKLREELHCQEDFVFSAHVTVAFLKEGGNEKLDLENFPLSGKWLLTDQYFVFDRCGNVKPVPNMHHSSIC